MALATSTHSTSTPPRQIEKKKGTPNHEQNEKNDIARGTGRKRYFLFPRESVMKFLQERCNKI